MTKPSSTSWQAVVLRLPCSRLSRRARPTLTSTLQLLLREVVTEPAEAVLAPVAARPAEALAVRAAVVPVVRTLAVPTRAET